MKIRRTKLGKIGGEKIYKGVLHSVPGENKNGHQFIFPFVVLLFMALMWYSCLISGVYTCHCVKMYLNSHHTYVTEDLLLTLFLPNHQRS